MSSSLEILQKVELNAADFDYLNQSKSSITVYWFIDCIYQANTTNFTFSTNFTKPDIQHEVLGIVVADFVNKTLTTPAPSVITTTVSPNISTLTTTTSTTTTTTAAADSNISTSTMDATATTSTMAATTTPPSKIDPKYPHSVIDSTYTSECQQKKLIDLVVSVVQFENQQKYGYFSQTISVKGK